MLAISAMNIFWLGVITDGGVEADARKCAESHCDKHVVKMILELAQLLCTAVSVCDYDGDQVPLEHFSDPSIPKTYKNTHWKHPCAVAVRKYPDVYRKTAHLLLELCKEYTRRYDGRTHATEALARGLFAHPPKNFRLAEEYVKEDVCEGALGGSRVPLCMPKQYWTKRAGKFCAVSSYRKYYVEDKYKAGIVKYKTGNEPKWLKEAIRQLNASP